MDKTYYTPSVKRAIYKWREDNEQWRQYANDYAKKNYEDNKEHFKEYAKMNYDRKMYYSYERIAKTFRHILL